MSSNKEVLANYAKMKHRHMNFVKEREANRLKDTVKESIKEMDEIMLVDGTRKFQANIDMNQNLLKNLAQAVDDNDCVTKKYLENSFDDCLKLDKGKQRYDVGENQLTGISSNPISSLDAINKQYFDTNAITADTLNKTLDDFATKKYVDDEIQKQDQGDESAKVDLSGYAKKEYIDTHVKNLKEKHKLDINKLTTKLKALENQIKAS